MADLPFSGGERLEAALKEIGERLGASPQLRVGLLEGATYPNGVPVGLVAAVNEFGAPSRGIPARPAIRGMIADKSPAWGETLATLLERTNYDGAAALDLLGELIKGQWQEAIYEWFGGPPLKPATIARKGFDKQLVDSAHMVNSVGAEVSDAT